MCKVTALTNILDIAVKRVAAASSPINRIPFYTCFVAEKVSWRWRRPWPAAYEGTTWTHFDSVTATQGHATVCHCTSYKNFFSFYWKELCSRGRVAHRMDQSATSWLGVHIPIQPDKCGLLCLIQSVNFRSLDWSL